MILCMRDVVGNNVFYAIQINNYDNNTGKEIRLMASKL